MRGHRGHLGWVVALTATLWLALVPAANAYIDAGSVAVVFQAAVAGIAAAGMFLKIYWRRIVNFFQGDTGATAVPTTDDESTPDRAGAEAP